MKDSSKQLFYRVEAFLLGPAGQEFLALRAELTNWLERFQNPNGNELSTAEQEKLWHTMRGLERMFYNDPKQLKKMLEVRRANPDRLRLAFIDELYKVGNPQWAKKILDD